MGLSHIPAAASLLLGTAALRGRQRSSPSSTISPPQKPATHPEVPAWRLGSHIAFSASGAMMATPARVAS